MHPSEADGTGHPRRFGYVRCEFCKCWRPASDVISNKFTAGEWFCRDYAWCSRGAEQSVGGIPRGPVLNEGWDANGAPTGIDANGDAA